ncbi:MAG: 5'-methylthioadenosine/S-adenosylhomocysteine nucleosidase, partial [Chloroflexi bacterium]|nr:5'-methylthioadenosine/S-adenosylhomocysteine nucleosidase [Chloroflexota bacterium]
MIGILAATGIEAAPLRKAIQARSETGVAGLRVTTGQVGVQPVALAVCGMGKVNAARGAQVLCASYRPSLLLMSGGAGALAPELKVGDIVVADAVIQYDLGAWTAQGFRPAGVGATWRNDHELIKSWR